MTTKHQIEKFRKEVEKSKLELIEFEKKIGAPTLIRAESAMRKFFDMPHRFFVLVLNEYYPQASRAFAEEVVEVMIDISERSEEESLRLNPQRIEWLRRWAEGCSESNDRISNREPYAFFTEQGQELVRKAISKGYMEETSNGYKWNLSNALLAYFSGRLISGDIVSHSNGAPHYVAGKEHYDDEGVNALFGTKNIKQSRYQLINEKGPKGYLKIDDLFV